jgi:hypothetical protein
MIVPKSITFKHPSLLIEYQQIRARLQLILEDMAQFTVAHGFEFMLTDVMSEAIEDKKLKRVSKSHSEGRAADVRVRDWSEWFKAKFEKHFEAKYKNYAAISLKSGKSNLIEIHSNGNGLHCHIQIKDYKEV